MDRARSQPPEKLAAKTHAGPKPRLSFARLEKLEGLLRQGAKTHGWHSEL